MGDIDPTSGRSALRIAAAVAAAHGVDLAAMRSSNRTSKVCRARQEAMASIRAQRRPDGRPRYSLPMIARFFHLKHHGSVLYALKAIGRHAAQPQEAHEHRGQAQA